MLELVAAYFPLALLIFLMTKRNSMASSKALPLCAAVAYAVIASLYQFEALEVHASVISGALLALTPISIIAGAIFLFKCMELTGSLETLKQWLNSISDQPVAQLMMVGWAFAFLIEGASGFGTPAAIAAPILISLGFPALRVAVFCLVLNTIPVTFGAVGTPIWFGLSLLDLPNAQLLQIGVIAASINSIAAFLVVLAALRTMLGNWSAVKQNLLFILLSTLSCVLPYFLISLISVEFPALFGGMIGLVITVLLAKYNVGLGQNSQQTNVRLIAPQALLKASFPLLATIGLLVITRIEALGLKSLLQVSEPYINLSLGWLGEFRISAALVISLQQILGSSIDWRHSLLYVPSILPFLLVGALTLWIYGSNQGANAVRETAGRITKPFFALLGALIFVNLMMLGENHSAAATIGNHLAAISGDNWTFFAPLLGALGSFFSGSATISNLTFAGVQVAIAEQLALDKSIILALQSVGAAMGNMVCINNIVAVTAIIGLSSQDGVILKKTAVILILYAAIAGVAGSVLMHFV